MLSRVADSLYWMSRYLERAEQTARILDVHMTLMLDQFPDSSQVRWERILASLCLDDEDWATTSNSEEITRILFNDPILGCSIYSCVGWARENARQIRDCISSEMWEEINRLYFTVKQIEYESIINEGHSKFTSAVTEGASLFHGVTDNTLSHSEGYQFIQMGRFIERALMTIAMLDAYREFYESSKDDPGAPIAHLDWVAILKSNTAFEAYCRQYTATLKKTKILEFLLLDKNFPHSVRFSIERLCEALQKVGVAGHERDTGATDRLAGRLHARLNYTTIDEVMAGDISVFLRELREACESIHTAINKVFISYPIEQELKV